MIASVRGEVLAVSSSAAVVEVGGVGLLVQCTPPTLAGLHVGRQAALATCLQVREDALTLYGFAQADERDAFEILLTATGVGPRLAQAVLTVHSPEALRAAVASENLPALMAVPGIGRKVAARMVLELRDRLGPPAATVPRPSAGPPRDGLWREQLQDALLGLGWAARDAETAVTAVESAAQGELEAGRTPQLEPLLRLALRSLART